MVLGVRRCKAGLVAFATVGQLALGCTANSGASSAPPSSAPASSVASGGGTSVAATETEYAIDLGATSVPAGDVTFQIRNAGTIEHEFVVVKTDLAADKLPMGEGEVDEDSPQLGAVDEVEDIEPGATPTLTVSLPAGHYVVFCNIPGHYQLGMHADFTTSG